MCTKNKNKNKPLVLVNFSLEERQQNGDRNWHWSVYREIPVLFHDVGSLYNYTWRYRNYRFSSPWVDHASPRPTQMDSRYIFYKLAAKYQYQSPNSSVNKPLELFLKLSLQYFILFQYKENVENPTHGTDRLDLWEAS